MAKSKELVIVRTQKRKLHNNKRIITGVGGWGCVRERGGGGLPLLEVNLHFLEALNVFRSKQQHGQAQLREFALPNRSAILTAQVNSKQVHNGKKWSQQHNQMLINFIT